MPIVTTLSKILAEGPCGRKSVTYSRQGRYADKPELIGWLKGLAWLKAQGRPYAPAEEVSFSDIVASNGVADALWCCRTRPDLNALWRKFDAWCVAQQAEFLVPELRPAYTSLLAHVEGHQEGISAAHKGARDVRSELIRKRNERAKRMGLTQAMEWSTTDAAGEEFSATEIATALCHALAPEAGYEPGLAAYYAAEAAPNTFRARRVQEAKFLEIVK